MCACDLELVLIVKGRRAERGEKGDDRGKWNSGQSRRREALPCSIIFTTK